MEPQLAYFVAKIHAPAAKFDGNCVDYHGCYVFPYSTKNDGPISIGTYVFVDKESGDCFFNDPGFMASEYAKAPNLSNEVDFSDSNSKRVFGKAAKSLASIRNGNG